MDFSDEGILISARPLGEANTIAELFTRAHGRHLGLVRGGRSRRMRPLLQPGNVLSLTWRARLADHLGSFAVELLDAARGPHARRCGGARRHRLAHHARQASARARSASSALWRRARAAPRARRAGAVAGAARALGVVAAAGFGLRARPHRMRRDWRRGRFGLCLAAVRPGGLARGGAALWRQAVAAAALPRGGGRRGHPRRTCSRASRSPAISSSAMCSLRKGSPCRKHASA